ncbi:MAG: low-specificity L-threonine aldolase [Nitrospinales bacterium]
METIDLRSDTVTQPTKHMREAMAKAVVGDDVLNEDPTVHNLQNLAAEMFGKESALFVPSGTMGNLISLLVHCQRGDEVILGDQSHIFLNEVGGLSALGGIHPRILPNAQDGTINLETIESSIRHDDLHYPPTRLICLENTHNYCSGSPITKEYMAEVGKIAKNHNLNIHIDGARIFNAANALGTTVKTLAADADSVMFCLSKGLSAPVGSLICGGTNFIKKAKKIRKMLGGGMRQAGHLAAAGIVALEQQVEKLKEDHSNTEKLIEGLKNIEGIEVNDKFAKTNIIFFNLTKNTPSSEAFLENLERKNIKILMIENGRFRAVLNRHITEANIVQVIKTIKDILG